MKNKTKQNKQSKKWNSKWALVYDPDFEFQNRATTQKGVKLPLTMQTTLYTTLSTNATLCTLQ